MFYFVLSYLFRFSYGVGRSHGRPRSCLVCACANYLSRPCARSIGLSQHLNRLAPTFSPSDIVRSPDQVANLLGGDERRTWVGLDPAAIFNPALIDSKSPLLYFKMHIRIHLRVQTSRSRPLLGVSCLRQRRSPDPCLQGFVILSGRSPNVLRRGQQLGVLSCLYPNPTPADHSIALPELVNPRPPLSTWGRQPLPCILPSSTTPTKVVVKFTALYNQTAHRVLAEAQLAPMLHFCARVVGNLSMLDGKSIWQLQVERTPEGRGCTESPSRTRYHLRGPNIVYVASKGSHSR
jgi:hypothetical protein